MLGFLAEKPYLCRNNHNVTYHGNRNQTHPGASRQGCGTFAARFVEEADRNAKERRGSIDFTKQVAKMRAILKRSKLYQEG